jgi:hypothetical protein
VGGTAYGDASQENVDFNFTLALTVARDLHELADTVDSKHQARADLRAACQKDWAGPHQQTFVAKNGVEDTDASTMKTELVDLANKFAAAWAEARGEQDRINFARYVQHEEDSEGGLENFWEDNIAGDDHYGDPPGNPSAPEGPDYRETREPQYAEFEHRALV